MPRFVYKKSDLLSLRPRPEASQPIPISSSPPTSDISMPRFVYTKSDLLSLRPRPLASQPIRISSSPPPRSPARTPVRTPVRTPPTCSPPPGFGYCARSPPNVPRIAKGPDGCANFSRRIEYARNRTQPVVVSSEIDALFEDDFDAFAKRLATHAAHPAQFGEIRNTREGTEVGLNAHVEQVPTDALDDNVLEFFDSIKCQALGNGGQEVFAFGEPEIEAEARKEEKGAKSPVESVPEPVGKERVDPALGDLERWFRELASANANE